MSSNPTKQIDGDVAVGRNVSAGGNANIQGNTRVGHDLIVEGWLEARNIKHACKGLFRDVESLKRQYPAPHNGWWALIGDTIPALVYIVEDGQWVSTGKTGGGTVVDLVIFKEDFAAHLSEFERYKLLQETLLNGIKSDLAQLEILNTRITTNADNIATLVERLSSLSSSLATHHTSEFIPLKQSVDSLISSFNTLLNGNVSSAIDNYNEIIAFLEGIKDYDTLVAKLDAINTRITTNANNIATLVDRLDTVSAIISTHHASEFVPLKQSVDSLISSFNTLLDGDVSTAIDNYNEIIAFLEGIKDDDKLTNLLANLNRNISKLREEYDASTAELVDERNRKHNIFAVCQPVNFEADAEGAKFTFQSFDMNGDEVAVRDCELPLAFPPVKGGGVVRPQPGGAGIISGEDYGRFTNAADFTEGLDGATALRDIDFFATPESVSFTRSKYRLDGGNVWVDDDGTPVMVPADGLWPFPMASTDKAGAMSAGQAKALSMLSPLPFTFSDGGTTPYNLEGIVVYSTHYKRFYRDGQLISPEELGYNETTESGEIMASTKRLFICGNKHYRFTGRDFVNVETERNPDQRLVRRAPSINAHPGLAYADRGIIRLPQPGPNAGDSVEISLAGLYWQENGSSERQPLSDLPIHTYTDKISCDLTVEKEGDKVVVTRTRDLGDPLTHVSHLWIELLSIDEQDGYIGVRYDSSGRKIFYRGHKHFPSAKYKVNRKLLASDIKRYVRFGNNGRGSKSCQLSYAGGGLRMQVQVWAKTRVRYRSNSYGYYDDNGLTHKYQWHWKDADGAIVRRKTCLVRVRKRAMKGAWSDWCYFHISPFISGGIAESRQKRT